jgi:hypothetical protein
LEDVVRPSEDGQNVARSWLLHDGLKHDENSMESPASREIGYDREKGKDFA